MKKIFKKSLVCMLAVAMVLTMFVGTLVTSAASVTATKDSLSGSIKFFYNVHFTIDADDASGYGALVWREDAGEENAVDVENLKANTAVSISSISLAGIKNVFCVKPYAVIEGEKVYADTITASYAEWLVSKKDGNKYNAEINAILDTYYAMTGNEAYEGQATPELEAPADGNWEALLPFSVGEGAFGLGTDGVQGNFENSKVRVNVDYPEIEIPQPNLVTNGDLEERGAGWGFANNFTTAMSIDATKTGDGTNCMTTGDAKTMVYQTVAVERNTNYTFSVDVYNDSDSTSNSYIRLVPATENTWNLGSSANDVMDNIPSTNGEWKTIKKPVNTGDNDYLCFVVILNTGTKGYFDNFKIVKDVSGNLVTNGDLEERGKGWSFANNFTTAMSIDATKTGDGTNCMTTGDAKTMVYQTVAVERNTNYTFSVDVYNDSASTSTSYVRLVPTTENTWTLGSSANDVMDNIPSTNGEWKTIKKSVNTGDNDYLCFVVILNTGTKGYFDNFVIKREIVTSELVTNGDLEERGKGWGIANNFSMGMAIDTTKTVDGTNCITTNTGKTMVYQTVTVEKNVNYIFSFDVYNDSNSASESYVRLVPTDTTSWDLGSAGNNVIDSVASTNGKWETVSKVVNTGDKDYLCFVVILNTGTKAYFDNFSIKFVNKGALVYKDGNAFDSNDVSNADADILFTEDNLKAIDISNIALVKANKQYTVVPYIFNGASYTYGAPIKVSYADVIARALNSDNADLKAKANAYNNMYKAATGEYLCQIAE